MIDPSSSCRSCRTAIYGPSLRHRSGYGPLLSSPWCLSAVGSSSSLPHTLLLRHDSPNYIVPILYVMCHLNYVYLFCRLVWIVIIQYCTDCSSHVRCDLHLGRLTFLRYSVSASLASVSGLRIIRWPSQLRLSY